jgi:hypothetical protein
MVLRLDACGLDLDRRIRDDGREIAAVGAATPDEEV